MSALTERLDAVRTRLAAAAQQAGRDPAGARLVAVSKRHPPEAIREAYEAGQRDFGENYVQELVAKQEALADLEDLRWHFIGHLQRNKAKQVVRGGALIHTVDSERLAEALSKRAVAEGRSIQVLLEVGLAGEEQKAGCAPEALPSLLQAIGALPSIEATGLMIIPPFASDPEESRPLFRRLRELAAEHGLPELSMGMSADMEVAVEEGATLVRVGTAIFGPRP